MILFIKTDRQYSKSFLRCVHRNIRNEISMNINFMKLLQYSKKLSEIFQEDIDCYRALKQAIRESKLTSWPNCISILIPGEIKLVGTNISLETVILVMEYGRFDLKPYPLIRNAVKNIEENIDKYYSRYLRLGW